MFLEAKIELKEETAAAKKAVAAIIDLPAKHLKQPDLQYFTAVFVSAGTNLNGAHFLPSELVASEGTIVSKALDVEHKEEEIIGHIYDRAFMDDDGNRIDLEELANKEEAALDVDYKNLHVVIAGVIYKNRFPNIAKEVANGDWKVSMECYYSDYDVKIGDMVMSRREAEVMGLAHDDSLFGKMAKIISKGKEIAKGKLERVLRGIVFSGCGIVKNPANPPSVILETASDKGNNKNSGKEIVLNYDKLESNKLEKSSNNVTSLNIGGDNSVITDTNEEMSGMQYDDTTGICVNYKRRVYAGEPAGPDTEIIHEDWCTLYDQACTSFGRDTTDPECLRNQLGRVVRAYAKKLMANAEESDRREELVEHLEELLNKVRETYHLD